MKNEELKEIVNAVSLYNVRFEWFNVIFLFTLYYVMQEPLEAINLLSNLTTGDDEEPVDAVTVVYLLGSILNRLNSVDSDMLEEFSQVIN